MPVWLIVASLAVAAVTAGTLLWLAALRLLGLVMLGPFATTAPPAAILSLPSAATLVLGLIDGAITVLVKGAFGLPSTWQYVLSAVLIFLGGAGVTPLLGPAFRAALNLPVAVTTLLSAAMAAASYVLASPIGISHTASIWISGVLAFLAAVGFGTSVQQVVKSYRAKGGVVA